LPNNLLEGTFKEEGRRGKEGEGLSKVFIEIDTPQWAAWQRVRRTPQTDDRFARDLTVQLTGHDFLKSLGVRLIPATAPDFFIEDTPTAVLVRQVLGAIAQFEKTSLVAKLKAARERSGNLGGRKPYAEARPETVALAKQMHGQRMSLRKISGALAARGHLTSRGRPYVASAIQAMLD
jgi:Resolvase, N terminal domain